MKEKINATPEQKRKVLSVISAYDGEIIHNDSSLIKALFPESEIELAVKAYFIIVDRLNQKAELFGGSRLNVFLA
jgi:hypothetical protein